MKTVAILEGWAGGPKLSKQLRLALEHSNFKLLKSSAQAETIIAHSTGCYFLPKNHHAKLIILINPPYWPDESIIKRQRQMSKNEHKYLLQNFGWRRLFFDRLWGLYYILTKPAYSLSVLKNQSKLDFLNQLGNTRAVLVRNFRDEFCSPDIKRYLSNHKNVKYLELPGYHSDYYTNPEPYIELIQSEYERG